MSDLNANEPPAESGEARPFRRRPTERTLEAWESMVDRQIREAREDGDFDNLPGTGKPVVLERNPFAGDRELAFHALKNANLEPHWMSLEKELTAAVAQLERSLAVTAQRCQHLRALICDGEQETPSSGRPTPRWRRWLLGETPRREARGESSAARAVDERSYRREQFLAAAASLDRRILEYNQALPNEIRWLERPRLLPDEAGRRFDAACSTFRTDSVR